jgi:hypothetical protein
LTLFCLSGNFLITFTGEAKPMPRQNQFNPDRSVFVAYGDFGPKGYEAVVDPALSRADVVSRIARGDFAFDAVVRVVEFNEAEGWARNVTEDIFAEAAALQAKAAA